MKTLTYIFFLCICLAWSTVSQAQQDVHFTQFYEVPVLRNPSLAGIYNGSVRFTAAYRNQWESVTVPYRSMAIGSEFKILKGISDGDFMTLGFQVTNDEAGDSKLKRTQVLPLFAYHKLMNEEHSSLLSIGFMGGIVSENFDVSKLQFDDQFVNGSYSNSNPTSQSFSTTSFSYADLSTGLSFSSVINPNAKFYIGGSLYHFNNPSLSFMDDNAIKLNRKWGINAGLTLGMSTSEKLFLYADHFRQGANTLTQVGGLYSRLLSDDTDETELSITGGMIYRLNDAIIPIVKLSKARWSMGVSYDANISRLRTASNLRGGFEMTMSLIDPWENGEADDDNTKCPANIW